MLSFAQLSPRLSQFLFYFQVKSEVDNIFVIVGQVFTITIMIANCLRAILGFLPYFVVAFIVELMKLNLCFNMGIFNLSQIFTFLIIYDFR